MTLNMVLNLPPGFVEQIRVIGQCKASSRRSRGAERARGVLKNAPLRAGK